MPCLEAIKPADLMFRGPIPSENELLQEREIVYLVDDDREVQEGLAELLAALGKEVITFDTGTEYLKSRRTDSAACLIVDMRLPDMSGLELQNRLADDESLPIIFISRHVSIPTIVRAIKAGAIEFLTKPVNQQALETAVDAAFAQYRQRRQKQSNLAAIRQRFSLLTPREREVLPLIAEGMLNKQAAVALGISEVTLQVHRGQIMRKMAARSFAELVRLAEKLGIPKSV